MPSQTKKIKNNITHKNNYCGLFFKGRHWNIEKYDRKNTLLENGNPLSMKQFKKGVSYRGQPIKLLKKIGAGSYGDIYKGKYNGVHLIIKIIKMSKKHKDEKTKINFYNEIIIHSTLYCYPQSIGIPNVYFYTKYNSINNRPTYMMAIRTMDGTAREFLKNIDRYPVKRQGELIKAMYISVANIIELYQSQYEFHHRDLHTSNVMYKKIGDRYEWYIIDFGMSVIKTPEGRVINGAQTSIYNEYIRPNYGHDLRLFLVSSVHKLPPHQVDKYVEWKDTLLNRITSQTAIERDDDKPEFHMCYHDAFDVESPETTPQAFRKRIENIS